MKVNTALQKMKAGKPAFGYSIGLGSPLVAEMLSRTGIDFIFVDTQHGSWDPSAISMAFMAIHAGGNIPMARVAKNDYTQIGRLLDEGAMGIIVPMVDTPEQAKAAADACRIPPRGTRSWGWGAASRYGATYGAEFGDQLFVAVQLESEEACNNAEAIMATPGIDGCWIGPGDLALSLGLHPTKWQQEERHIAATNKVLEACRNTGKIPGYAVFSPDDALQKAEEGYQFLTSGTDISFLMNGAIAGVKKMGLAPEE